MIAGLGYLPYLFRGRLEGGPYIHQWVDTGLLPQRVRESGKGKSMESMVWGCSANWGLFRKLFYYNARLQPTINLTNAPACYPSVACLHVKRAILPNIAGAPVGRRLDDGLCIYDLDAGEKSESARLQIRTRHAPTNAYLFDQQKPTPTSAASTDRLSGP